MVPVMSPIRITAAGERIVEPIIALAHCSKLARIIVTGANSAEAVIDLHRLGYARAATTLNCGLPAGQYDVVLLDGRQRSIKAIETTLDWVADFLSLTGVLIVWLDPLQPATGRPLRTVLESHGFRIEAGTVHERGSAVAARRRELKPISKVARDQMQQFGSQDWRAGRIREWLLLVLRFAITCDPALSRPNRAGRHFSAAISQRASRMQVPRADNAVQTHPFRRNRQYSVPQIATITPITRKYP